MIHSSGQIISATAAETIENGIGSTKDTDGYERVSFKAVCVAESPTGEDAGNHGLLYGPWVKEGSAGDDENFLGVIGDDTVPYANREPQPVTDRNPVVNPRDSKRRTFITGDEMTVETYGILSVIAADDITQGKWLKLADGGAFQEGQRSDGIGLAIESAKAGERFRAIINVIN